MVAGREASAKDAASCGCRPGEREFCPDCDPDAFSCSTELYDLYDVAREFGVDLYATED